MITPKGDITNETWRRLSRCFDDVAARTYHTKLKEMLRLIFCININTHSGRK